MSVYKFKNFVIILGFAFMSVLFMFVFYHGCFVGLYSKPNDVQILIMRTCGISLQDLYFFTGVCVFTGIFTCVFFGINIYKPFINFFKRNDFGYSYSVGNELYKINIVVNSKNQVCKVVEILDKDNYLVMPYNLDYLHKFDYIYIMECDAYLYTIELAENLLLFEEIVKADWFW